MSRDPVFLRRLTADRTLVYHVTTCAQVARYPSDDYVEVPVEEVKAAYATLYVNRRWQPQRVMFEDRLARLNVCSSCVVPIIEGIPEWPPPVI